MIEKNKNEKIKTNSGERLESKKIIKIIIEWLIYVVVFLLIVWGTPRALTKILNTDYPIASVTSSSMWPALKKGDIVFIKGISGKDSFKIGDIVVYRNERGFTIHRVVEIRESTFVTKGDANTAKDEPIAYEKLVGKTVDFHNKPIRIPYLGELSQAFKRDK